VRATTLVMLIFMYVVVTAHTAYASPLYVGTELDYAALKFTPHYSYTSGAPDKGYTDRAEGIEFRMLAGYSVQLNKIFSLDFRTHFGLNNAVWDLDTTEPAHLEYKIPYTYGISLLPSARITDKASLLAEIGLEQGYIQEKKDSPVSSSYNFSKWVGGYTVGGGASCDLSRHFKVSLFYRYREYNHISYDTHLPDGTLSEIVEDRPSIWSINIGMSYSF
jgi:opacity protein-like surface antigen